MKKIVILFAACLYSLNILGQSFYIEWEKAAGGGMCDYSKELAYTKDGGSITVGYSESSDGDVSFNHSGGDCWIVKSNASGVIEWEKTFGGSGFDYGYSIQQTADYGYIIAGYTESSNGDVTANYGAGDCWVIKLDSTGTIVWQKNYGGTQTDNAQCIRQTNDGGYIVCGYSESNNIDVTGNHGGGDCWILKLSSVGVIEWKKSVGGSLYDFGQDIKQTQDGGYILTGGTNSADGDVFSQKGNGDCWLVKLDALGSIEWRNCFGGTEYDFGQSVQQVQDGSYIIAGYSQSTDMDVSGAHGGGDCWVLKCSNAGIIQWQRALGSSGNDYGFCIQQITGGGYILTGYSEVNDGDVSGNHGNYDCWIVQLSELGFILNQKSIGGTGVDIGYSIREIGIGSYIVAGYSESNDEDVSGNHGAGDCWLLKLNLSPLNVEENKYNESVSVSPNPSSGNFNFSGLKGDETVEIYDARGKLTFVKKIENYNSIVSLENESTGIYLYKVIRKQELISTGKIIITK